MSETVVAKRYADALFQLATEKNKAENLVGELQLVNEVFKSDKKILDFLNHPRVSVQDKTKLIDEAFKGNDKDVVNTLKILIERHRIHQISLIIDEFVSLYNEANGVAAATVYSVRALTEEEKKQLETSFKTQFNKKSLTIENEIDPSLIGGMKIRVGNTIYDGSISSKLHRMKQSIVSATL